ncbi:hypothetical protein H8S95_07010 [Pontibacter sp. KCTC 32443]|uniref:toxin-antitoxin system YwqK family antitoxin n=1 Tax=Pontibacter TaxID=323449 RepID=UPI00164D0570|nr:MULTISPECIES: hypothetical protein [Pontibacter]MBC5773807.1 hypothetical protein [Pontibacter sp. KCTC 32443]
MKRTFTTSIIFSVICYLLISQPAVAQESSTQTIKPSDCIQATEGNKYKFFFQTDYKLTDPECASIYRESSFDVSEVVFSGPFKDYRVDGLLLVEGAYKNGYLDSMHLIKYLNGNTWQRGNYKDGIMVGSWEYFFPDGKPMYTIRINGDKVCLDQVWNQDGKLTVVNGNGKATIYQYKNNSENNDAGSYWRGEVKNGLLQGSWKQYIKGQATSVEEIYRNGKFVKGYDSGEFFNIANFFSLGQEQSFVFAEAFRISDCGPNSAGNTPPLYPRGEETLRKDILNNVGKPLVGGKVIISFEVGEDGQLSEFSYETKVGVENLVKKAIIKLGPWHPAKLSNKVIAQKVTLALELSGSSPSEGGFKTQMQMNQNPHNIMNDPETKITLNPPTYKAKD